MEVQRGTSGQIVWGPVAGTTGARSSSGEKPSRLSLGSSCGGERSALTTARDWRKTSSRVRRHVHLKPGQVRSVDYLGTIAQSRMARNQREAVGGFLEVLGLGLGAAAYCGSEQDFEREPHRNRFGVLLGRTAHLAYHLGQAALARRKDSYRCKDRADLRH